MYIGKGYFLRKLKKNKLLIVKFFLIILIFCVALSRDKEEKIYDKPLETYAPIYKVDTNKKVFSVTIDLNGKEKFDDVRLLSQILKGMNVKATFFVTPQWFEQNSSLYKLLNEDHNSFGLQIVKDIGTKSRNNTIRFLASENDKFYSKSSYYPTLVRINSNNWGKIPELLPAFGQKYISASLYFDKPIENIDEGTILCINKISDDTPYNVAEFITLCAQKGYMPIPLEELLAMQKITKDESES